MARPLAMLLLAAAFAATVSGVARAEDEAIGWRQNGTGLFAAESPPVRWSEAANVAWKAPMPAPATSGPIVVGDRVFVTAEPWRLLCLSLADGKVLWESDAHAYGDAKPSGEQAKALERDPKAPKQAEAELETLRPKVAAWRKDLAGEGRRAELEARAKDLRDRIKKLSKSRDPDERKTADGLKRELKEAEGALRGLTSLRDVQRELPKAVARIRELERIVASGGYALPAGNALATPTPASDGRRVYVLFGTGVAACYDLGGRRRWVRLVEVPEAAIVSSPAVVGDRLVVRIRQLHALEADTGKPAWSAKVLQGAWPGSPRPFSVDGKPAVLTSTGDVVTAADGQVVWSDIGGLGSTPVVMDRAAYWAMITKFYPSRSSDAMGPIWMWSPRLRGGEPNIPEILRRSRNEIRLRPSVVYLAGRVLRVDSGGVLHVHGSTKGRQLGQLDLELGRGVSVVASPAVAGGHLYIPDTSGTVHVVTTASDPAIVARNTLDDAFRSAPVFAGNRMLLRGARRLYAIGK